METSAPRNKKVEQGEITRGVLIDVATRLFTEHGFQGTATEDIVRAADVTRGALYHHFASKEHLLRAVFESLEEKIAERIIVAGSPGTDPLDQTRRGIAEFLDACLEPSFSRICLIEAMSVLGWETWSEVDEQYTYGLLREGLASSMRAGLLEDRPVDVIAHIFLGAITHAALAIARAEDPAHARKAFGAEIDRLLDGLATDGAGSGGTQSAAAPRRRRRRRVS